MMCRFQKISAVMLPLPATGAVPPWDPPTIPASSHQYRQHWSQPPSPSVILIMLMVLVTTSWSKSVTVIGSEKRVSQCRSCSIWIKLLKFISAIGIARDSKDHLATTLDCQSGSSCHHQKVWPACSDYHWVRHQTVLMHLHRRLLIGGYHYQYLKRAFNCSTALLPNVTDISLIFSRRIQFRQDGHLRIDRCDKSLPAVFDLECQRRCWFGRP